MALDSATLFGAVGPQVEGVEDAAGDVKAAEEHLRAEVARAQSRVREAQGALSDRQLEVLQGWTDMDLLGRAMKIISGQSAEWPGADDKSQDLSGVEGELVGFEVGTIGGSPIEPPTAVIFHVKVGEGQSVDPGQHSLRADQARYELEALPKPDEEPVQ